MPAAQSRAARESVAKVPPPWQALRRIGYLTNGYTSPGIVAMGLALGW